MNQPPDFSYRVCETELERLATYRLRYEVFCAETQWIALHHHPDGLERDGYDQFAVPIIAVSPHGRVVGSCRLIFTEHCRLPIESFLDFSRFSVRRETCFEASRFAISPGFRGPHSRAIFRGLFEMGRAVAMRRKASKLCAVADRRFFKMLRRLSLSFVHVGAPAWHLGSESIPVIIDLEATAPNSLTPSNSTVSP